MPETGFTPPEVREAAEATRYKKTDAYLAELMTSTEGEIRSWEEDLTSRDREYLQREHPEVVAAHENDMQRLPQILAIREQLRRGETASVIRFLASEARRERQRAGERYQTSHGGGNPDAAWHPALEKAMKIMELIEEMTPEK